MRSEQRNSSVHDLCCWSPYFPDEGQVCPRVWSVGLRLQARVQSKQASMWEQGGQGSHCDLSAFLSTVSQPWGLCSAPELSREGWSESGEGAQSSVCSTLHIAACECGEEKELHLFVYFFMATHKPSQIQIKMKSMKTFLTFSLRNVTEDIDHMEMESPCHTYQSSNTASPVFFHRERSPKGHRMGLPHCSVFSKISQMKTQYSPFHVFPTQRNQGYVERLDHNVC